MQAVRLSTQRSITAIRTNSTAVTIAVRNSHNNNSNNGKQQQQQQQNNRFFNTSATAAAAIIAISATTCTLVFAADPVTGATKGPVDWLAVRKAIADILDQPDYDDGSLGPLMVRLAWHGSGTHDKHDGTGGSNGGLIRHSPECSWAANKGLHIARDVLEPIKRKHPNLSYADLYTLAGCVAIEEMGGPKIQWRPGRSDYPDGTKSPKDGRLPDASQGAAHVRQIFYRMGFNDREIVALCGAHSLGRCHTDRSGFSGPWTNAPTTFSNEFYRLLLNEKWTEKRWNGPKQYENSNSGSNLMMLPSDLALIQDPKFKQYVELYAKDEAVFTKDFAEAFSKLLELGVIFPTVSAAVTEGKSNGGGITGLWKKIFG